MSVLIYIYSSQALQLRVQPIRSHREKDYSVLPLIKAFTPRKLDYARKAIRMLLRFSLL